MRLQTPLETADLAWAFASLCGLLRVPFESRLFLQQFPPPATLATLSLAAGALGLKLKRCRGALRELAECNAPVIAARHCADGGTRLALILCADSQGALVTERDSAPRSLTHAELAAGYEPDMLAVATRESALEERELTNRAFGLAWFLPRSRRRSARR